jgi:hypothetical protein
VLDIDGSVAWKKSTPVDSEEGFNVCEPAAFGAKGTAQGSSMHVR